MNFGCESLLSASATFNNFLLILLNLLLICPEYTNVREFCVADTSNVVQFSVVWNLKNVVVLPLFLVRFVVDVFVPAQARGEEPQGRVGPRQAQAHLKHLLSLHGSPGFDSLAWFGLCCLCGIVTCPD